MSLGSSSSTMDKPSLSASVFEKLTRDNFLPWQAQVLPDIRGAQMYGFLDGSSPALEKTLTSKDADGKEINPEPRVCQMDCK
jgi:hypothetical protein